jgi:hypothetical protein
VRRREFQDHDRVTWDKLDSYTEEVVEPLEDAMNKLALTLHPKKETLSGARVFPLPVIKLGEEQNEEQGQALPLHLLQHHSHWHPHPHGRYRHRLHSHDQDRRVLRLTVLHPESALGFHHSGGHRLVESLTIALDPNNIS